ncbi:hypothetical protein [Candidatus Halobonum tyrrellensis]|uniref:Uncharacterized protein n=1 Tax=Candidatus Halobonum tyrrellensis G22 TaxID=1324957 RepID=V4HC18_9EURY|nr:hypothetical protein [Candidatus Halobonum tyrrellensis]ESP88250.1 hypothetical protein K933_10088 [Candidatus Halobonum tyrrellensis G22]
MGHCPHCETELREVVASDTDARYESEVGVWECPACGAVLGVERRGV